jgi:hypothetical protein
VFDILDIKNKKVSEQLLTSINDPHTIVICRDRQEKIENKNSELDKYFPNCQINHSKVEFLCLPGPPIEKIDNFNSYIKKEKKYKEKSYLATVKTVIGMLQKIPSSVPYKDCGGINIYIENTLMQMEEEKIDQLTLGDKIFLAKLRTEIMKLQNMMNECANKTSIFSRLFWNSFNYYQACEKMFNTAKKDFENYSRDLLNSDLRFCFAENMYDKLLYEYKNSYWKQGWLWMAGGFAITTVLTLGTCWVVNAATKAVQAAKVTQVTETAAAAILATADAKTICSTNNVISALQTTIATVNNADKTIKAVKLGTSVSATTIGVTAFGQRVVTAVNSLEEEHKDEKKEIRVMKLRKRKVSEKCHQSFLYFFSLLSQINNETQSEFIVLEQEGRNIFQENQ